MSGYPAFTAYAVATLVLVFNLAFLWAYSGFVRAKSKLAINPEDSNSYGVPLDRLDPPAVARVLRAHANAQATILPFLFLGLVFLLAGGGATTGWVLFGLFTLARLAHSACYLNAMQPWRTISFSVSILAMVVLMVDIIRLIA